MKVALVGCEDGWREALSLDDSWEIWGLNNEYRLGDGELATRATRWFELHGDTPLTRARRPAKHWDRLANLGIPIYTLYDLPGVKTAIPFPIDIVANLRDYFACTFAYQIGLALVEGATAIHMYGTPLIGAREALVERPCVEWWLGFAHGRQIETEIIHQKEYGLGRQPYRYAYNDQAERYLAYRFAYQHAADVTEWINYEEMRLNIKRPWWDKYLRMALEYSYGRRQNTPCCEYCGGDHR